jgi:hypothetical protein
MAPWDSLVVSPYGWETHRGMYLSVRYGRRTALYVPMVNMTSFQLSRVKTQDTRGSQFTCIVRVDTWQATPSRYMNF